MIYFFRIFFASFYFEYYLNFEIVEVNAAEQAILELEKCIETNFGQMHAIKLLIAKIN